MRINRSQQSPTGCTQYLLLNILHALVSWCIYGGFTALGPNCVLKLDGLKSIPLWHTFQVWTDWKPSGLWIWPSLEDVYEINSQSTAGLCLPLCYILMMPSNSIWKNRKFCKSELKSGWVKLVQIPYASLHFIQCPLWKQTPERIPSFHARYFAWEGKYILTKILERLEMVSLTYSEPLKIMVWERSMFFPAFVQSNFNQIELIPSTDNSCWTIVRK